MKSVANRSPPIKISLGMLEYTLASGPLDASFVTIGLRTKGILENTSLHNTISPNT